MLFRSVRCGSRSSGGSSRSVDVAHVDEEVGDVGEEVVVGEGLEASRRASALSKNLITPLPYMITRGMASEACSPTSQCTPRDGVGKLKVAQNSGTDGQSHVCSCGGERSDLL